MPNALSHAVSQPVTFRLSPFSYIEVADFTENQIEIFAGNWFRNGEGEKDRETSKRFLAEFAKPDNKGLRDLARTPLLLTLLCLAYNETLTFPQRRVEIYQEALEALLKKWDSSRRIKRDEVYRKLSLGHKENMLARIAAQTFERNEYFVPQPELERLIIDYAKNVPPHDTNETTDGEAILKAIEAQHGIFVERAHGVYSFSHLTFQEYFTARYIVSNSGKGTLTNLITEHCSDERWREVFLLTASLLSEASHFMTIFRCRIDELVGHSGELHELLTWATRNSASIGDNSWWARRAYFNISYYNRQLNLYNIGSGKLGRIVVRVYAKLMLESLTNVELTAKMGLDEFKNDLTAMMSLNDQISRTEWQTWKWKLRASLIRQNFIDPESNLTEKEGIQLTDYFRATRLLQDCLGLAFMPPEEKKAMLDSLYLPPAPADEAQNVHPSE